MVTSIRPGLWLNNIPLDLSRLDMFSLLSKIRQEADIFSSFKSLGINSSLAFEFLTTPLQSKALESIKWGEAYNFPLERVIWWNNLEKDQRYKRFPDDLYSLAMPSYPGQLKYIRKNLFSAVFFLDLSSKKDLEIMSQIFEFVTGSVPIRFGIVPVLNEDDPSSPCKRLHHTLK